MLFACLFFLLVLSFPSVLSQTYDGGNIYADTNDAYDIGTPSLRWKSVESHYMYSDNYESNSSATTLAFISEISPLVSGNDIVIGTNVGGGASCCQNKLGNSSTPWGSLHTDYLHWTTNIIPQSAQSTGSFASSSTPVEKIRCQNLTITSNFTRSLYYSFLGSTGSVSYSTYTTTKVNYTVDRDQSDSWNTTNDLYIAKIKGVYSITFYVSWDFTYSTGGNRISTLEKNGSEIGRHTVASVKENTLPITLSQTVDMDVGDEIAAYVYHNQGSSISATSTIGIHLLHHLD
jgi:hypothetical protein